MDGIIKSFTITPSQTRFCDRCHMAIGPDRPNKSGMLVKDGPCTGFFHNSACWQEARDEMEKAQGLTPVVGEVDTDKPLLTFGGEEAKL